MSSIKELENDPIMQIANEHEHRITKIEENQKFLQSNFTELKADFKELKDIIRSGNKKQEEKLDLIDKRLMDEFFIKKRSTHDTKMKLYLKIAGGIIGGGGFLYLVIERIIGG